MVGLLNWGEGFVGVDNLRGFMFSSLALKERRISLTAHECRGFLRPFVNMEKILSGFTLSWSREQDYSSSSKMRLLAREKTPTVHII